MTEQNVPHLPGAGPSGFLEAAERTWQKDEHVSARGPSRAPRAAGFCRDAVGSSFGGEQGQGAS